MLFRKISKDRQRESRSVIIKRFLVYLFPQQLLDKQLLPYFIYIRMAGHAVYPFAIRVEHPFSTYLIE